MQTTASRVCEFFHKHKNYKAFVELAESLADVINQNWTDETTVYHFPDGSFVSWCGSDCKHG